jgi:hypothetical protein
MKKRRLPVLLIILFVELVYRIVSKESKCRHNKEVPNNSKAAMHFDDSFHIRPKTCNIAVLSYLIIK